MLNYITDQGYRFMDPEDHIYPKVYLAADYRNVISAQYISVNMGLHRTPERHWLVRAHNFSFWPRATDYFTKRIQLTPGYSLGTSGSQYQLIKSKADVLDLMFNHGKVLDSQPSTVETACTHATGDVDSNTSSDPANTAADGNTANGASAGAI